MGVDIDPSLVMKGRSNLVWKASGQVSRPGRKRKRCVVEGEIVGRQGSKMSFILAHTQYVQLGLSTSKAHWCMRCHRSEGSEHILWKMLLSRFLSHPYPLISRSRIARINFIADPRLPASIFRRAHSTRISSQDFILPVSISKIPYFQYRFLRDLKAAAIHCWTSLYVSFSKRDKVDCMILHEVLSVCRVWKCFGPEFCTHWIQKHGCFHSRDYSSACSSLSRAHLVCTPMHEMLFTRNRMEACRLIQATKSFVWIWCQFCIMQGVYTSNQIFSGAILEGWYHLNCKPRR